MTQHETSTGARPGRSRRRRRLGLRYRAGWRFTYLMLSVYGPAQLGGAGQPDPRALMRRERAERVDALDAPAIEQGRPAARRPVGSTARAIESEQTR